MTVLELNYAAKHRHFIISLEPYPHLDLLYLSISTAPLSRYHDSHYRDNFVDRYRDTFYFEYLHLVTTDPKDPPQ